MPTGKELAVSLLELTQQRRNEPTKRPVAHHEDHVSVRRLARHPAHELTHVCGIVGFQSVLMQRVDDRGHTELLVSRYLVVGLRYLDRHTLRAVERVGVLFLMNIASAGIGARLE